ncbi:MULTISPECIES: hypothetical protein [Amycolatopsis]|uniref:hypothetical protein n=1 Tax=Amycolatopsis TaxID=1813 RepID=UPI00308428B2
MPYPPRVPSTGRTPAERARLTDEVYGSCAERGLASGATPRLPAGGAVVSAGRSGGVSTPRGTSVTRSGPSP